MLRIKLLPLGFSLVLAIADFNPVLAFPIAPQVLSTAITTSAPYLDLVRFGGVHPGMGGVHRAAVRRYRVGGHYYGGVWYGMGRCFWHGR